jgi:DNA-binding NtrC family response regulator
MPGMGGLDVLRQIKKSYPHIQVIILTGRGSTKEGIKGMRLGAFDYLMKPVKIEMLMQKMNEAFQAAKQEKD